MEGMEVICKSRSNRYRNEMAIVTNYFSKG